ncbi:MAG: sigma-70 family RNA polymerase sigma factor [Phycisphaera sp.]|nr:sigma-70 family RNA polymerase sigma factor [Phycisphaera sp.]
MRRQTLTPEQAQRFRRLAWPMMDAVLRTAQVLTRHEHEAEDLAQETMMKAMRAIDSFEEGSDIKAWLFTILRRAHIDRVRPMKNRAGVSLDEAGYDPVDPRGSEPGEHETDWAEPESLMNRFEDRALIDAMKTLPEEMRWTLLLVDVEQMDHAEAARVLGVAVGTVKSRSHRARSMLRERLHGTAVDRGWVKPNRETTP